MSTNLVGGYQIDKSNLLKPDLHLVIGTRKQPTPAKPKHYILQRQGKAHKYLSSLYLQDTPTGPQDAQIWEFDYQGGKYTLTIKTGGKQAEIALSDSISSINNMELGANFYPINLQTKSDAAA